MTDHEALEALLTRYEELVGRHYRFLLRDRHFAEKYEADLRLAMDVRQALRTGQLIPAPSVDDAMVERVARSLCDDAEYVWDKLPEMPDVSCGHGQPEGCRYYWRRLATAAISAMGGKP